MDIRLMSGELRRNHNGHLENKLMQKRKAISIIRIITHGTVVTIVENMDTFQRITYGHISEEITRNF